MIEKHRAKEGTTVKVKDDGHNSANLSNMIVNKAKVDDDGPSNGLISRVDGLKSRVEDYLDQLKG